MSWLFGGGGGASARASNVEDFLEDGRSRRAGKGATTSVTGSEALRISTVWACRRLRADLVSTLPIDVFRRRSDGTQVEVDKPLVMLAPGGEECRWIEWLASSQMDLDGYGNAFGVIEVRDNSPQRRPLVIRLVPAASVAVRVVDGRRKYTISGKVFDQADVWHERQFTVPGIPVGLSPIAHAALTLNASLSAAEFANAWFNNGAQPSAHLKNTARKLNAIEARSTKANFKAQVQDGDVFVTGNDWSYEMMSAKASEAMFLEQGNYSNADACRFMGVPGDLVDVHSTSGSVTYANITQRNLQFLIMNLDPTLVRREDAFTYFLLPEPRYAKFNRPALLRMDAKTRTETQKLGIDARILTPDEAREQEDRRPLTAEQVAQFAELWPSKSSTPSPVPSPPGGMS